MLDETKTPAEDAILNDRAERVEHIAELLMRYRTDLYAYARSILCNHHDTEDLLQDVSAIAVRCWRQYEPGTNFRAWTREIARRRLLERLKKPSILIMTQPETLAQLERAAEQVEDAQPVERRREALRHCLGGMQGLARRVLELRYTKTRGVSQIAGEINRTVQATYALLKRAKQALRKCVDRRLSMDTEAL